jgi:hypothetical protein
MAQFEDISVGDTWVSLNVATGLAVGTAFKVQNKSTTWVLMQESATQPLNTSTKGEMVTDLFHTEPSKLVVAGSLEIWVKSTIEGRLAKLTVQTV